MKIRRRQLFDYIFWGGILFGSPILMLFGLNKYPLINQKVYSFLFVGLYFVSLAWTIWLRKKLFSWAHKKGDLRFYEFCGLLSVPIM